MFTEIKNDWYKIAKNYSEIGHSDSYILWFSPDGNNVKKTDIKSHTPNSLNSQRHSTWDDFKKDSYNYRGRYDIGKKAISIINAGIGDVPKSLINNLLVSFPDAKTIDVFSGYSSSETIKVANNKTAQTGEWWIIDGQAVFADSNVGDMGHEGYVIDDIQRKYAYDEFDKGEYIDWDGFKKELALEAFEEEFGKRPTEQYYDKYKNKMEDLYLKKLKEMGMSNEEYLIAEGQGDARGYGMANLGWIRVAGNNIQTQLLTSDVLNNIANGLFEINDELEENSNVPFNIEVVSTGAFYTGVPYKLISDGQPSQLREYQQVYANNKGWYKKSQNAIYIHPEDLKKIMVLVNKIIRGERDWTNDELQLQQNYPKIIEKILEQHMEV